MISVGPLQIVLVRSQFARILNTLVILQLLFLFLVTGEEVGWVQCDKCEKWYHLICVEISAEEADTIDEYICPDCKPPPPKKKLKKEDTTHRSNSPKLSDQATKMASKLTSEAHTHKNELQHDVGGAHYCSTSSSDVDGNSTHSRTSISNTPAHTGLRKELCDPVVPTDKR